MLAGFVLQTNALSAPALVVAVAAAMFSLVEIKASRRYKALKRSSDDADLAQQACLEGILKCISAGVLSLATGLALWRWIA